MAAFCLLPRLHASSVSRLIKSTTTNLPSTSPSSIFPACVALSLYRASSSMAEDKFSLVRLLQTAKEKSGKTYSQLAAETGLTNVYVAQLLRRQAQLKPDSVPKLRAALPDLNDHLLSQMMKPPMRSYDPQLIQEPAIYRLNEAVMHFGESVKEIINEDFGDGIMSAIDFYCSVDKIKGVDGKERVVVTLDGKYLPHSEHKTEDMVSTSKLRGS